MYDKPTSFSQNNLFSKCPRTWYYSYIKKIPTVQDMSYAFAGNVIHETIEQHYNGLFKDIQDAKNYFRQLWNKKRLHNSFLKEKIDEYWLMVINAINKKVPLTSTELKIFYPDVIGYLDGISTDNDEIHDWKSSKRYEENEEEYKRQLMFYAWLYKRKFGRLPKKATVHYLRYIGEKGVLEVEPTNEDMVIISSWHNHIRGQMARIKEKGEDPPMCEHCHMFCPYKNLCLDNEGTLKFTFHIIGNYIRVNGPINPLIDKALTKKFSYELKNAYFIKKAKPMAKTTIEFWSRFKRILPIGFKNGLVKTLTDYGKYKNKEISIDVKETRQFSITTIKMPEKFINGKVLRDYQQTAVDKFLRERIAILEMATGSGKTEVAIELIRRLGVKTLFMVDKIELLRQTKKRIEDCLGIEVGQIGGGVEDIKDITVCTVQSITKHLRKYSKFLHEIRFAIFDECLSKDSRILLPDGTQKSINEIYNDDNITEVLSYNEEKKIFESKKIVRKIKQPMNNNWYHLIVKDEIGTIHKLKVTNNHKIWTSKGYKRVDELNTTDVLKVNLMDKKYKCDVCNTYYEKGSQKASCLQRHKYPDLASENGKKSSAILKEKRKNKEFNNQIKHNMKLGIAKAKLSSKYWIGKKEMGMKRTGKNNPVFKDDIIEKISKTQKRNFMLLSKEKQINQIKRFMEAPRYRHKGTNKPEQLIVNMKIINLEYTGNGTFWYWLNDKRRKNPDFKVVDENKVIEVGDFQYWHTKEEADSIIEQYNNIGVKCLYLDVKELNNNYNETKQKIEKFCYNHSAKIVKIHKSRSNPHKNKQSYKYNLEIEDNHNYIANRILVSNCHKVPAKSYWKVAHYLLNTEYRLGISATSYRDDGNDMYIQAICGYKAYEINAKKLVDDGWLVKPRIIFLKDYMTKEEIDRTEQSVKTGLINETPNYANYYNGFISNNSFRDKLICDVIKKFKGKKILILSKLIEHGKTLKVLNPQSQHLFGATNKEDRKQMFDDFSIGKINVLVSTISIFSEGIDLPSLDVVINVGANKGDVKTVQMLGRVLRKLEGKNVGYYIDFVDETKFFKLASYARIKALRKQGHIIEELNGDNFIVNQ